MYALHPGQTKNGFTDAMYHILLAPPAHSAHRTGFIEWGCGNGSVLLRLSHLHPARGAKFLGIELDPDMANLAKEKTKHDVRITILCHTFIIEDMTPEERHNYYQWHHQLPSHGRLMHYFNNHNYRMALDHQPERPLDSRLSLQVHDEHQRRAQQRRQMRHLEPDIFVSLGMVPNLTGWLEEKKTLASGKEGWSWSDSTECPCYKYTSTL